MIVAIRRGAGAFVATPGPDEVLGTGDVLIGVGSKDEIRRLEELFAPQGAGVA
jgi:K+/H+ antiporter YhaU regulatory subunit KhtT